MLHEDIGRRCPHNLQVIFQQQIFYLMMMMMMMMMKFVGSVTMMDNKAMKQCWMVCLTCEKWFHY